MWRPWLWQKATANSATPASVPMAALRGVEAAPEPPHDARKAIALPVHAFRKASSNRKYEAATGSMTRLVTIL